MASNEKSFTNTKLYILVLPRVCPLYILGFTVKVLREVREQRGYYKLIKAELIKTLRSNVNDVFDESIPSTKQMLTLEYL